MAEKRNLSNVSGAASDVTAEVLGREPGRKYLLIQNTDATDTLYVQFGAVATLADGLQLAPGEKYEPPGEVVSSVNVIAEATKVPTYVIVKA